MKSILAFISRIKACFVLKPNKLLIARTILSYLLFFIPSLTKQGCDFWIILLHISGLTSLPQYSSECKYSGIVPYRPTGIGAT